MTSMNAPNELDLMAYADGQLASDRAAAVEAALARDPQAAARVAEIREHNRLLRDGLDGWLAEPCPARLLAAATPPASATPWRRPALAMAATLVLGLALGWFAREALLDRQGTPTTFARQAAFAHALYSADQRRSVEVWANEEKGLVTWLTRRMGVQAHAPDLNGVGFALVGGRLLSGHEKPTALLMYENADKQRLTLQWRKMDPGANETAFRYAIEDGVSIFYWIDHDCAYALSGNLDRTQLLAVARVVYGQLAEAEAAAPKAGADAKVPAPPRK
jgi:anti-sigma factor RsiW